MPDTPEIDEATAVVRWLLEAGLDGLGLTTSHALRRAVVREAAERWPHWWRHELFGPPHRESDLPVLAEVHAALRRWLDGSFFGSDEVELTSPDTPDEGVATAEVPLAELDLHPGQRIGYVFDFGDDWRVRLTVRERVTAEPGDHPRVLQLRGTPPPQYPALDDLIS